LLAQVTGKVDFAHDVQPLFQTYCYSCPVRRFKPITSGWTGGGTSCPIEWAPTERVSFPATVLRAASISE
jgi:hypothetical protein